MQFLIAVTENTAALRQHPNFFDDPRVMPLQEMKTNQSRWTFLFPLLCFLVLAALLAISLTLNPRDLPSTLINKPAPNFELTRLYQNTMFSPHEMRGQKWILNVWASWCAGCRVEHPLLNQLAQQTSIPIIGLNYKDSADNAKQWLTQRGNPYAAIPVDDQGDVGIDYGVYGVPETFVIDEQGKVIYKHTGPLSVKALNQELLPLFESLKMGSTGG